MAKMKEDPLWMQVMVRVILSIVFALIGFFTPVVVLVMSRRSAFFPLHHESGPVLLIFCLIGAVLGAVVGPLLYTHPSMEGAGKLDEIRRMSGRGSSGRGGE